VEEWAATSADAAGSGALIVVMRFGHEEMVLSRCWIGRNRSLVVTLGRGLWVSRCERGSLVWRLCEEGNAVREEGRR
jgi:hypothetical protein